MARALRIFSPIMSIFGGGERESTPTVLAPPPPPADPEPRRIEPAPPVPTEKTPDVKKASDAERKKAALAGGRAATIKTSSQGLLAPANTARKTLLGQ